ncbi:MAG TPA: hypothetical protein VFE05_12525 [Longimicrobiaceae bacterium]|jgi:hypothetical protein|nr:hypothetical protein [Longimicrobiaceae bacterium]
MLIRIGTRKLDAPPGGGKCAAPRLPAHRLIRFIHVHLHRQAEAEPAGSGGEEDEHPTRTEGKTSIKCFLSAKTFLHFRPHIIRNESSATDETTRRTAWEPTFPSQ